MEKNFKTDYEEGRLQSTPAAHPQLATLRANYFLLVVERKLKELKGFLSFLFFLFLS
jgi:hypothetical protein